MKNLGQLARAWPWLGRKHQVMNVTPPRNPHMTMPAFECRDDHTQPGGYGRLLLVPGLPRTPDNGGPICIMYLKAIKKYWKRKERGFFLLFHYLLHYPSTPQTRYIYSSMSTWNFNTKWMKNSQAKNMQDFSNNAWKKFIVLSDRCRMLFGHVKKGNEP